MRGRQRQLHLLCRQSREPPDHMFGPGWGGLSPGHRVRAPTQLPAPRVWAPTASRVGINNPTVLMRELRLRITGQAYPLRGSPGGLGHKEGTPWEPPWVRIQNYSCRGTLGCFLCWSPASRGQREKKGWASRRPSGHTPRDGLSPSCPGSSGGGTEAQRRQALCPAAGFTRDRSRC